MKLVRTLPLWGLVSLLFQPALASDDAYPLDGTVVNSKELSALQYECELETKVRMTCKFTQLVVRKKLRPSGLEKRRKEFEDSVRGRDIAKDCEKMQEMFDYVDGKRAPPKPPQWKDPRDKQEFEAAMKTLKEGCEK